MPSRRGLLIFTTLLGNNATTHQLLEVFKKRPDIEADVVLIGNEDFLKYPPPFLHRLSDGWMGRYVARQKAAPFLDRPYDFLLVNAWEFVIEFRKAARRIPAAALMDAVPATVDAQLRHRGRDGWKRALAHQLHHFPFRAAAREYKLFLPMGSDCAAALEEQYGVDRGRCLITLAPQNLESWKPAPRQYSPLLRLLTVTNDFFRKGGGFLLDLYVRHLAGKCALTIASNDPVLRKIDLPQGVTWLRGLNREDLLSVYQSSDLFVLPTLQDYMPQVLAEALATGLPCMASDVGGIRDLVSAETGYLMSPHASVEAWAERLKSLIEHPESLRMLALGARRFAEEILDERAFERLIGDVIARLLAAGATPSS